MMYHVDYLPSVGCANVANSTWFYNVQQSTYVGWYPTPPQYVMGWVCPNCRKGLAPWVASCCAPNKEAAQEPKK
jgi:hypothetical protein